MVQQSDERARLLQLHWRDVTIDKIGSEPWVVVYASHGTESGHEAIFSALIPNNQVQRSLANPSWDLMIGSGMPGYTVYHQPDGREEVRYHRLGDNAGIEPFVLCRDFHGLKESSVEIIEEFRLFHNLYYDRSCNQYVKFSENGDETVVVRVLPDQVEIRLNEIRQFLAIKEMHLAVYFEVVVYSAIAIDELPKKSRDIDVRAEFTIYAFNAAKADWLFDRNFRSFSRLLGKKLIPPYRKDQSGFWPYERPSQRYEEFIIGVDQNGKEITRSCNEESLRHSADYLTPIFFKREVLSKYYSNPAKYSVEDSYLRCGGLWSIMIDNNNPEFVVVYLGDLGRDLEYEEQMYWRSFNVQPEGSISKVHYQRSILAQFADPTRADLAFKYSFNKFQSQWHAKMGWYLFEPLSREDRHFLTSLRIPLANDQAEFDAQVLALSKILIDSLNEKELEESRVPKSEKKGISKLEAFLASRSFPDHKTHIKFLRNLQSLRSAGVAHRKGREYIKIAQELGLKESDLRTVFEEMLHHATRFLDALDKFLSRS